MKRLAIPLGLLSVLALAMALARADRNRPGRDFNHDTTPFPLAGAHRKVACESCHPAEGDSRKWAGVPRDCHGCHGDRRNHKGLLGERCEACHAATSWTRLTHPADAHRFSLTGKHQRDCVDCHKDSTHLAPTVTCGDCHRQPHGGTHAVCSTCHTTDRWRTVAFKHAFSPSRLPGKHQAAPCLSCHPQFTFKGTSFQCESCHTKDLRHDELGECQKCHSPLTWKESSFRHDAPEVGFAITGRHAPVACAKCHETKGEKTRFAAAPRACEGCHKTTPHADLGPCARCHSTAGFSKAGFSHDSTRFPLDERHRVVKCADCHTRVAPGSFQPGPAACASCHRDPHGGQFPAAQPCTTCHVTRAWIPSTVDASRHVAFKFSLHGTHEKTACAKCHTQGRFVGTPKDCRSCHVDRHRGTLGNACATCHNEVSWKQHAAFDHGKRTGFALSFAHAKLDCDKCHGNGEALLKSMSRPITCASCHTPKHGNAYGTDCAGCHPVTRFADGRKFDHSRTLFPLERRHKAIACASCHDPASARKPDPACKSCHGDPHAGRTFLDCADCHRPDNWLLVRYDHDQAEFPLKGKHFFTPCRDCHTNDVWTGLRRECVSCHRGDRQRADVRHADHAALSWDCIDCHRPWDWAASP
jgi:hypothetical protein